MSPIPILHEDQHLLVIDKPAGTLVVAATGHSGSTVVEVLQRQVNSRVYAVHRLDEDTTGVLLLARDQQTKTALEEAFRQHSIERTYLAVVSLSLDPSVELPEDSSAEIGSNGLLGDKFVALVPGGAEEMLGQGDEIMFTQGSIDVVGLIGQAIFSSGAEGESDASGTAE